MLEQYIRGLDNLNDADRLRIFHTLIERYPVIKSNYISGIDNLSDVERLKIFSSLITKPEIKDMLNKIINSQTQASMPTNDDVVPAISFGTPANSFDSSANGIGGQRKSLAIPGRGNMLDNNQNGFSTYLLLAILAFTIQFLIVLICIFFYK